MPVSIVAICASIYLVAAVVQLVISRSIRQFLLSFFCLFFAMMVALSLTNATTGRVAFGAEAAPLSVVAMMFVAALFGIAARYLFYLQKDQFTWIELAKPLCITPIVLLPLFGSMQGIESVKATQIVSFALLAFQNGFFWQAVLDTAKPKVAVTSEQIGSPSAKDTPPKPTGEATGHATPTK